MKPLVVVVGAIAVVAAALVLFAPRVTHTEQPRPEAVAVQVKTVVARKVRIPDALELAGTLEPIRAVELATRVSGRITALTVEEGDAVRKGQLVARVDTADVAAQAGQAQASVDLAAAAARQAGESVRRAESSLSGARASILQAEAQLQEARVALGQAELDHGRARMLYADGAVPKSSLDQADTALQVARARVRALEAALAQSQASLRSARATLDESRAARLQADANVRLARTGVDVASSNLAYGELIAPFDGVVTRKMAWEGDLAAPGSPLVRIEDVRHLRLTVPTPEEALRHLRLRQSVRVHVDALDLDTPGLVTQIVPSGDPQTRTFTLKVGLVDASSRLVPGLYARIRVPTGSHEAMVLPGDALVRRGQLTGVYVVEEGRARLRWIRLGAGGEVLSGLEAGDRIIVNPPADLEDGRGVKTR